MSENRIGAELSGEGIPTHSLEESVALTGNSLAEPVAWTTGAAVPPTPAATLRPHLENARTYACGLRPVGGE